MFIPKTLKIKRSVWKILFDAKIVSANNAVGLCYPNEKVIYICPNQTKFERWHTMVHELFHAIWPLGIVDPKVEEKIVNKLAKNLCNTLIKNNMTISRYKSRIGKRKIKSSK